jgi:hypothetical protein
MKVRVEMRGPLFEGNAASRVVKAIDATVKDIVAEGERLIKLDLYPGHGLVTGHYARSIHGEMSGTLHGVVHDSNVVYGPWLETGRRRGQQTRFRGLAHFRRATQQLQANIGRFAAAALERLRKELGG